MTNNHHHYDYHYYCLLISVLAQLVFFSIVTAGQQKEPLGIIRVGFMVQIMPLTLPNQQIQSADT